MFKDLVEFLICRNVTATKPVLFLWLVVVDYNFALNVYVYVCSWEGLRSFLPLRSALITLLSRNSDAQRAFHLSALSLWDPAGTVNCRPLHKFSVSACVLMLSCMVISGAVEKKKKTHTSSVFILFPLSESFLANNIHVVETICKYVSGTSSLVSLMHIPAPTPNQNTFTTFFI